MSPADLKEPRRAELRETASTGPLVLTPAGRQFPWRILAGAALLAALVVGLFVARPQRSAGGPEIPSIPGPSAQPPLPPDNNSEKNLSVALADGALDAALLHGEGATLAEVLATLANSGASLRSELSAHGLLAFRLSRYEGDARLSLADVLGMLSYLGLSVERKGATGLIGFETTSQRQWRLLTAPIDPDGLPWGALRPWRRLKISHERGPEPWLEQYQASPSAELLYALAHSLVWCEGTISVGDDGRVNVQGEKPAAADVESLRNLFIQASAHPAQALRAAAAFGLGQLLALDAQTQLPADDPTLGALARLLKDGDGEVASAAALALGQTASVEALALLTNVLIEAGDKPGVHAAVLTALVSAESLGRRLDENTLGQANLVRRQSIFEAVRTWMSLPRQASTAAEGLRFGAAWLKLSQALRPEADAEYPAALLDSLWKSGLLPAQLAAVGLDPSGKLGSAAALPPGVRLATLAGPAWAQTGLDTGQILQALNSDDPRLLRAMLWRLGRPETRSTEPNPGDEAVERMAERVLHVLASSESTSLRRLALEALYREHRRRDIHGRSDSWRMRWNGQFALKAFLEEADAGVQYAAAGALAQVAGAMEINAITHVDLNTRAPQALERLANGLTQRWMVSAEAQENLVPATMALAERLASSVNSQVAAQGAYLRVQQPGLSAAQRLRLVRIFKEPVARAGAIRGLSAGVGAQDWDAGDLQHLLTDESAIVRKAIFDAALPRKCKQGPERAALFAKGLEDSQASVRLAAIKALGSAIKKEYSELVPALQRLAESDPESEVRVAASAATK